jgi:endo-1,4-beta-xylanase
LKRLLRILLPAVAALLGLAPVLSTWDNPLKDPIPNVEHKTFRSDSMNVDVGYNIYLPPGYAAAPDRRYPVIYWLHGLGGNETTGMFPTSIIDRAIKDKSIPPFIVVFANGGARTRYHDSTDGKIMADTLVARELIGHIDQTYRTVASRDGRAISGMSMGANGSLKFAFKYPELFSSVVAFAPALVDGQWMEANDREFLATMFGGDKDKYQDQIAAEVIKRNAQKVRGNVAILILIGKDDRLLPLNQAMHKLLEELKVPHEYEEHQGVGHDLDALLARSPARGLIFAAKHFKEPAAREPAAKEAKLPR